jgi:hypothetical protein
MTLAPSPWEYAARHFMPRQRRWATPGDLAKVLDPTTIQTPALDVIDRELVALADGDIDRLMVFMSPQEGKSVRVSHRFVEWLLVENPDLRVAIVSYADEMARRWGSDIKLDCQTFNGDDDTVDLGLRLPRRRPVADRRPQGRRLLRRRRRRAHRQTGRRTRHRRPAQGPGAGPISGLPGAGVAVLAGGRRTKVGARLEGGTRSDALAPAGPGWAAAGAGPRPVADRQHPRRRRDDG